MELEALKWVALALLSVVVYFLQRTLTQTEATMVEQKAAHTILQNEVNTIKNEYLHKNDFKDFKHELRGMFEDLKKDIVELRKHS